MAISVFKWWQVSYLKNNSAEMVENGAEKVRARSLLIKVPPTVLPM